MKPITFPKLTLPGAGSRVAPTLGNPLVDDYLESVHARLRPNSTLAVVYDLKVFFTVIDVDPIEVRRRHVLEFIRIQRTGSSDATVVPINQSEGLALWGHLPEQHRASRLVGRCQACHDGGRDGFAGVGPVSEDVS